MNRQWKLKRYPDGMPTPDDWEMVESAIPRPGREEILVKALYLDISPYMRGKINPTRAYYGSGVEPGDTMIGGAIGEVMESNSDRIRAGQLVVSDFNFGWQDYSVFDPDSVRIVNPDLAPVETWLDALGVNGVTAYLGLFEAASMQPGDTVVVSAAAGSVGQITGQLARIAGGCPVAVTSSAEKLEWCREIGFDRGVDYQNTDNLAEALKIACPGGIDVYFDNTAGAILDAVLQNLAVGARITLCGTTSLASKFGQPDIGDRYWRQIITARARLQGFLVLDYPQHRYNEAQQRLGQWVREGRIQHRFDVVDGFDKAPEALIRVLSSKNLGKQLVAL
ncbi:MAG: NADP-dependent oxidoreductase [Gemmatimonadota bacterium]|nr:NADP-dependent oxidoreductase [Gemmatimonadota bacterium]